MSIPCRVPEASRTYTSKLAYDRQGNLYCSGVLDLPAEGRKKSDGGGKRFESPVWSFSPEGELRWYCREHLSDWDGVRMALGADGDLYLWSPNRHALLRLSTDTGELRGELGGRESTDASAPHLDLEDCRRLQVDRDGTLLAEIHDRLLRWAPDGVYQRTWPAPNILLRALSFGLVGWERRRPLYRSAGREPIEGPFTRLPDMQSAPLGMTGEWCLGWDQHLYVCDGSNDGGKEGLWLAKLARSGDLVYKVRFPKYRMGDRPPQADAAGRVYLDVKTEQSDSALVRISPDGGEARRFTGAYKDHEKFAVAPDGTLAIARDEIELLPPGQQASRPEKASQSGGAAGAKSGGRRSWTADHQSVISPGAPREAMILLGVFVLLGAVRILFQLFWFQPLVEHHARKSSTYESRSKTGVTRISAASCRTARSLIRGEVIKEGAIAAFFIALLLVARKHPVQALFASMFVFVAAHGIQWAVQPAVLGTMPQFWLTGLYFVVSLTTALTVPVLGIFVLRMHFG